MTWDIGAYEFDSFRPPRFSIAPELTPEGWTLNITGAPNKWARLQRSGELKNWEDVGSAVFMGDAGAGQITDNDPQEAMFYRVVVQQ